MVVTEPLVLEDRGWVVGDREEIHLDCFPQHVVRFAYSVEVKNPLFFKLREVEALIMGFGAPLIPNPFHDRSLATPLDLGNVSLFKKQNYFRIFAIASCLLN